MTSVEDIYKHYEVLDRARDSITKHEESYVSLLAACKAGDGQKRLAPSFISKFFKYFPKLADQAIDTLLDLCEEDDPNIRKLSIKVLPRLCQDMPDQVARIADVLTQLLQTEEQSELRIVKEALLSLFKLDVKGSLAGLFSQILQGVEASREQAVKFLQKSVGPHISQLLDKNEEAERYFLQETKKVLAEDVTGEEFQAFMFLLPKLKLMSSASAIEELAEMVASQAGLTEDFQADDSERVHKLLCCMKSAIPFFQVSLKLSVCYTTMSKQMVQREVQAN
ncbi:apoptosis inhibitor 5-like [Corticium candelabrum]|uniref:apoptosis inhibitor 5-like n=1 Tax=Corticium candelabrum TaxID=121492 RepID=UPI002E25DEA1|nr:apoptosis inhibitor 5-like [Corticium candelabrum]